MHNLSMSASQEISLLAKADTLKKIIISLDFDQPLNLLMYHCLLDLTPIGLALLGYDVCAVNSDPLNTQRIQRYVDMLEKGIRCYSHPIAEIGKTEKQAFDVIIIDGTVMTELRSDAQLENMCQQLSNTLRPDGLLIITTADFDDKLMIKDQFLPPLIIDDRVGRRLEIVVRDWHGNGYEYTETHYRIMHSEASVSTEFQQYQRRAWRNAELTLALTQAGFEDVMWQSDEQYIQIMTAKHNRNSSD